MEFKVYEQEIPVRDNDVYVSYETAQLLKEEGYNVPCAYAWIQHKNAAIPPTFYKNISRFANAEERNSDHKRAITAPTQGNANKWISDNLNARVVVTPVAWESQNKKENIPDIVWKFEVYSTQTASRFLVDESFCYATPEEAMERGLVWCIVNKDMYYETVQR